LIIYVSYKKNKKEDISYKNKLMLMIKKKNSLKHNQYLSLL